MSAWLSVVCDDSARSPWTLPRLELSLFTAELEAPPYLTGPCQQKTLERVPTGHVSQAAARTMAALRGQTAMDGRMVHDADEILIDDAVLKRCKTRTICALNMAFLLEKTNEQVIPAGELPGLSKQLIASQQCRRGTSRG